MTGAQGEALAVYRRLPWVGHVPPPGVLEKSLTVVVLLLFCEALLSRVWGSDPMQTVVTEAPWLRYTWYPAYLFALAGLALVWQPALAAVIRAPVLIALPLLAFLSAGWSVSPEVSERRAIALTMTIGFGVYLAARYRWRTLLQLLGITWAILAVGSLISVLVSPSFGIMSEIHPGAWRGLWWEKNTLGGHMARGGFLFACLALIDPERRKVWIGFCVLAVFLVLMSTSKTSLLGLLLGFALLIAWVIVRQGPRLAGLLVWGGLLVGGTSAFILLFAPELVFEVLGRDATLTGRTDIWVALDRKIADQPQLGFGYAAFWGEFSPPAIEVREETEWPVPTAHNGWLEIVLALGFVGLALFALDYMIALTRATLRALRPEGLFALGWLMQMLLFSLSESVFLLQNNILTVTWATLSAKLALAGVRVAARKATSVVTDLAHLDTPGRLAGAHTIEALPKRRKEQHLADPLHRPVEPVRPGRVADQPQPRRHGGKR
jgi:O-antigen ligase